MRKEKIMIKIIIMLIVFGVLFSLVSCTNPQGSEIAMIEDIKMTIENYKQLKAEIVNVSGKYEAYVLLSFPQQFNSEIFSEIERN